MPKTNYFRFAGVLVGEKEGAGPNIGYVPDTLGSIVEAVDQILNTTYTATYNPYGSVFAESGTAPNFAWICSLGYLVCAGVPYAEYSIRLPDCTSKVSKWTSIDLTWPGRRAYSYVRGNP